MEDVKQKKILIVDDEQELRTMIDGFLRKEGFSRIYHAGNCVEALAVCRSSKPDLAILDVMLPDGDGFGLLTSIRQFSQIPVLFVSARGEDEDRLLGLGLGADDYIVKPFLPRELILRLTAVLKRVYTMPVREALPIFQLGECTVNLESAVVSGGTGEQPLTAKEHALLLKLYENRGRIVTSDALCQAAWGDDYAGYENTLMVHIRRIREKIEPVPSNPVYLLTVRGLGYKLLAGEA
ncbi:response regulator transcription factor [Paenibacillus puldeungensis]|uniref:Response regulator transcription factor n=1 Tax=Paenibacillus puldeungensis TaxID=696536 RepID=A0ABW3S307_9BACL